MGTAVARPPTTQMRTRGATGGPTQVRPPCRFPLLGHRLTRWLIREPPSGLIRWPTPGPPPRQAPALPLGPILWPAPGSAGAIRARIPGRGRALIREITHSWERTHIPRAIRGRGLVLTHAVIRGRGHVLTRGVIRGWERTHIFRPIRRLDRVLTRGLPPAVILGQSRARTPAEIRGRGRVLTRAMIRGRERSLVSQVIHVPVPDRQPARAGSRGPIPGRGPWRTRGRAGGRDPGRALGPRPRPARAPTHSGEGRRTRWPVPVPPPPSARGHGQVPSMAGLIQGHATGALRTPTQATVRALPPGWRPAVTRVRRAPPVAGTPSRLTLAP